MSTHLILATLAAVLGAVDTLAQAVYGRLTAAFLLVADVWVIVIIIGCTIIIIIVIVVRTRRE